MTNLVTDISTCWLFSFANGTKLGFTDFDQNLVVENITYQANGGQLTDVSTNSSNFLSTKNIFSVLSNVPEDFLNDSLQSVNVSVFFVKRATLEVKQICTGIVSSVQRVDGTIHVEISSLATNLDKIIAKKYSKTCRASIYSAECGLVKSKFELNGSIKDVKQENLSFVIDTNITNQDYYKNGLLLFKTGLNAGLECPVDLIMNSEIFLRFRTIYPFGNGDQISLFPGCDKNFNTCIKKFNNAINFRGEPYAYYESELDL